MHSLSRVARICCLDLDSFFVSVERLLDPSLMGQPVIVGAGPGQRGVVLSASYEVRRFGVRSGQSMTEARRLAPHAYFVPPRGNYSEHAQKVRDILESCAPVVQTASIDEFLLDFHGCEGLFRSAAAPDDNTALVRELFRIRARIQNELGLPASAGVGCTRVVAKMASNLAKPLAATGSSCANGLGSGVVLIPPGSEREWLGALPLRRFPGIGPVQEARLEGLGFRTLSDVLRLEPHQRCADLADVFARIHRSFSEETIELGRDRPAFREHDPEGLALGSLSNESTFHSDLMDTTEVDARLAALVERVCFRARSRGVRARTVSLKLRYNNFKTLQRSRSGRLTAEDADVLSITRSLLQRTWTRSRPLRLLGVGLSNLEADAAQLALPFYPSTERSTIALDQVRERFGFESITRGTSKRH